MIFFQFVLSDLTRFVYPENIGGDTRIVILCLLELDIFARLNYQLKAINIYVFLDNNYIIYKIRNMKLFYITVPNLVTIYCLFLYNDSKDLYGF